MLNKKQDNVDQINESLSLLSDAIFSSYKKGTPIDAIINTVNDTIGKIEEDQKKLVKKL